MFVEDKSKFAGVKVKPDPFTLEALIAWLRTRDPAEIYDSISSSDCLLCRYAGSLLQRKANWGDHMMLLVENGYSETTPCNLQIVVYGEPNKPPFVTAKYEKTFSAALARAEALLA